ncbi:unnamed protein product [Rotaria sp. Silwood2]|nr:unnamed protein product [Rotaria sp. Silwood2]CAF2624388.1 unnamed protein product [Rotaria sp. Silwood2]CAF3048372.1 unnamed protein product [Rotaria sp. Silwood2]CAF3875269.1 unnamed protein product [Rotaria sp. Silwood2]CAF4034781.1 unnamed protein product [Rotaria sp. Silwood2]
MSVSRSSARQVHTVLGGGIRYETVELVLSAIPNFELKQKGRILHLFAEIYNAFVQEIQEALDERQNNLDSFLVRTQSNTSLAEPFAFESQIDTDTYPINLSSKSTDELLLPSIESDNNISNETVPSLVVPNEKDQSEKHPCHQQQLSWTSVKDTFNIKKEIVTPPKTKRRQSKTSSNSKQKKLSSIPSMRQMTMTQLFDPIESPKSTRTSTSTSIKQEPDIPGNDTIMYIPESLIGLAQPSESMSDNESEQNNLSDLLASIRHNKISNSPSFKRKYIPSPIMNNPIPEQTATTTTTTTTTDEEENIQNEALIESPYAGIDNEELLYACPMCRNYWLGLPEELRHKQGLKCRHRKRPVVHTPEHFWSLGIPNTQTCIQRGYGGVLPPDKPIERPRRPRRQYQRRLQERQLQQQNDNEEE